MSVDSLTQQEKTTESTGPDAKTSSADSADSTAGADSTATAAKKPADAADTGTEPSATGPSGTQPASAGPDKGETTDQQTAGAEQPEAAADTEKPKRGRAKATGARKTRTVELTLTVTGTADGEWQAELKHGSKWIARGLDVPAAAVSRAAKELHIELSGPIDEVIDAAREQQQAKVEELEAELARAKQALAELES